MTVPILAPVHHWECRLCGLTDTTREARVHTRMHPCPRLGGLTAPMVPAGTRCKVEVNEREDYVGRELVQTDAAGRPVMNVTVTRDEGTDVAVYAPCATLNLRAD